MSTPVPVSVFIPNEAGLVALWREFEKARPSFDDSLPTNPIGFVTWLASTGTQAFILGDASAPDGVFIFSGITPGDSAFAHVFIWGREKYTYPDLLAAARVTLGAVFVAHNLRRVLGLTPVTNMPARAFAEAVGFKVAGRLREAVTMGGMPTDAWVSDILRSDLEASMRGTIK